MVDTGKDMKKNPKYSETNKTNSVDKDGKHLLCHECDSIKHFVEKCLYRNLKKDEEWRNFKSNKERMITTIATTGEKQMKFT